MGLEMRDLMEHCGRKNVTSLHGWTTLFCAPKKTAPEGAVQVHNDV